MVKYGFLGLALGILTIIFCVVIVKALIPNVQINNIGDISMGNSVIVLICYIVIVVILGYIFDLIFKNGKK